MFDSVSLSGIQGYSRSFEGDIIHKKTTNTFVNWLKTVPH